MKGPRVDVLGPPRVIGQDGHEQDHLRRKAVALLAYLVVEQRTVGRDTLATLFWPECGQSAARRNLRTCLSSARAALGTAAVRNGADCIHLDRDAVTSDYHALLHLAAASPRKLSGEHGVTDEAERLLCVGDFLEGFTLPDSVLFDAWQFRTGERVRALRVRTIHAILEDVLARGNPAAVLDLCSSLLTLDVLDETSHRLAMRVLAGAGCWEQAQQQFHRCAERLDEELGAEPDPSTVELYERIRRHDPDLRAARSDSGTFRGRATRRLPRERAPLFGREEERERLRRLLGTDGVSLITLTGSAGSGKTRLAVRICHEAEQRMGHGVVFVDLTLVHTPSELLPAISSTVGLRDREATRADLIGDISEQLDGRKLLLVLDNFEQVIAAAGDISTILRRVQGPKFLITSREALRIEGEFEVPVPPLKLPQAEGASDILASPAVQLFLDQARRASLSLQESEETLRSVRSICSHLGGLPLALELVVPLLHVLSPQELAAALPQSVNLLDQSRRDVPDRHRSLQAAFDWSYDLLSPAEKRLFAELSVLQNGYDYHALARIYQGALDATTLQHALAALLEKNLLHGEDAPEGRFFGMLEPLRQYGRAKAEDELDLSDIESRRADYYAERVHQLGPELHGREQEQALRSLSRMHPNVRASLQWLSAKGEIERGLCLASDLIWFWYRRNHARTGVLWLHTFTRQAAEAGRAPAPELSFGLGLMTFLLGAWRRAAAYFEDVAAHAELRGDGATQAMALGYLGVSRRWLGDYAEGWMRQEESLAIGRTLQDPVARTIVRVAGYCTCGGVFPGEPPLRELERGLSHAAERGDEWSVAHFHNGLGDLYCESGDSGPARREYLLSAGEFARLGDRYMEAWNYEGLGRVAMREGSPEQARSWTARALHLSDAIGDELNCALLLARCADLTCETDPTGDLGGRLAGAALTVFSRIREDEVRGAPQVTEAMNTVQRIQRSAPAAFDLGRYLTRSAAVELALGESGCT